MEKRHFFEHKNTVKRYTCYIVWNNVNQFSKMLYCNLENPLIWNCPIEGPCWLLAEVANYLFAPSPSKRVAFFCPL